MIDDFMERPAVLVTRSLISEPRVPFQDGAIAFVVKVKLDSPPALVMDGLEHDLVG